MFKIHVLNVRLGDSLILETVLESESHFSIIDCKSLEGRVPTVEFLRERGISRIQSLFLTHLHNDHYSGFPQLLDYLRKVNGTLEYFVSPQIPDEIEIWRQIVQLAHDEATSAKFTAVLKAMKGLQALPACTTSNKKVMPVRFAHTGSTGEGAWQEHLHSGLFFAPVSPTDQEAFQLLRSAINKASLDNKVVNAISHAFLVRYDTNGSQRRHLGLFTGDLEGRTWRYVKNRCLEMTASCIRSELRLLKVPHHGAYNHNMDHCLEELIDRQCSFSASISCPPADPKHPDRRALEFLRKKFNNCCIACTNISAPCHAQGFPSITPGLFEQPVKEAEFLDVASSQQSEVIQSRPPGACAGDHTITISENSHTLTRSSGLPCSFNPSGCRS